MTATTIIKNCPYAALAMPCPAGVTICTECPNWPLVVWPLTTRPWYDVECKKTCYISIWFHSPQIFKISIVRAIHRFQIETGRLGAEVGHADGDPTGWNTGPQNSVVAGTGFQGPGLQGPVYFSPASNATSKNTKGELCKQDRETAPLLRAVRRRWGWFEWSTPKRVYWKHQGLACRPRERNGAVTNGSTTGLGFPSEVQECNGPTGTEPTAACRPTFVTTR